MRRAAVLVSLALFAMGCSSDPADPACVPQCSERTCGDDGCGGSCGACAQGSACVEGACRSTDLCADGILDGEESDVDCGGACAACALGRLCRGPSDCASALCGSAGRCEAPASCSDGQKNGAESDLDCGGGSCPLCAEGRACVAGSDCATGLCPSGLCAAPSCEDGVQNGEEAGIDCGGGCAGCPEGAACEEDADCFSRVCAQGRCAGTRVEVLLGAPEDAISSYLMNLSPAAWNLFHGSEVPIGRHWDTGHVSYHTALRFEGVRIPAGATITSARLSFYPTNEVDSSNNLWINVYAEKSTSSAPFDPSNSDAGRPDQRAKTTAFIDHWLVRCNASCTELSEYDCPQRQLDCWDRTVAFTVPKDLKALVQEVVAQPGWEQGNALTLFLVNSATDEEGEDYLDSRSITGYDPERGVELAPKLVVDYQP